MSVPDRTLGLALLASGRDADVFALDGGRVLRRYRSGGDVAAEVAVMRYVIEGGFPTPAVYEAQGSDMVLERVEGPSLLRALFEGRTDPVAAAEVLADLHGRLDSLPPPPGSNPGDRILHRDLHPDNVILGPSGPVLLDWRTATLGPPELDWAMTAVILAEAACGSFLPAAKVPAAREMLAAFLSSASSDLLGQLDRAGAMRRANPNLTGGEIARVDQAVALVVHTAAQGR